MTKASKRAERRRDKRELRVLRDKIKRQLRQAMKRREELDRLLGDQAEEALEARG